MSEYSAKTISGATVTLIGVSLRGTWTPEVGVEAWESWRFEVADARPVTKRAGTPRNPDRTLLFLPDVIHVEVVDGEVRSASISGPVLLKSGEPGLKRETVFRYALLDAKNPYPVVNGLLDACQEIIAAHPCPWRPAVTA